MDDDNVIIYIESKLEGIGLEHTFTREKAWKLYRDLQTKLVGTYQGRNGPYT